MQASNRIIVNTVVQYVRTLINLLLSLYSARLVLDILGIQDYGIYSLIAGVASMLSFLTNSLVGSTQRFLSVHQGKDDINKLKNVFSNSLMLHLALGFFILLILESFSAFLFSGFLNIPSERLNPARIVYQLVILMVYISFIAAPYRALFVSRENIVYISIIDVLDGILKVVFVLLLPFFSADKLVMYGWIMVAITFVNLLAYAVYGHCKYEECVCPRLRMFDKKYIKELSSFTGWVTYSSLCIALRNQGIAIVFNKMLGTAINAAYGIGMQICGMVSFVSSSFSNAVAPQLMAAEGYGNRDRMWMLAEVESKFSFLLLSMVGIPAIFEMQSLLNIWLVKVPESTMLFGSTFLIMSIVDMLTSGLGLANKAIGRIAKYTLVTYTPKLLILPIGWVLLNVGCPIWIVCLLMIVIESICMFLRIVLFIGFEGFKARAFIHNVMLRSIPPVLVACICCWVIQSFIDFPCRFLLTFLLSITLFACTAYYCSFNSIEQAKVDNMLSYVNNKIFKK